VWQSFVVLAIILLVYTIYSLDLGEPILDYAMEAIIIFLVCYLLWRVETLSDLNIPISSDTAIAVDDAVEETVASEDSDPLSMRNNIGPLLKQHCEDSGLYLQHDISVSQLAQTIGTNRFYLSQYFSSRGMTYNSYINRLRIQHFIDLYREAAATHQPITVLQLAHQSGFRSYSTFNAAFKQSMGMTATEWMRNMTE
jgi:AraC-like DNA-binding protein